MLEKSQTTELLIFGLLLGLLLLTSAVYWPGLSGPFLLDDVPNLSPLGLNGGVSDWQGLTEFVLGNTSGPSGRPVSMLSFLIDAQDWPGVAENFKYTNLMIHLLCGLVLFWFCLRFFLLLDVSASNAGLMALAVAALWLLHPLNLSTTLYVVQRMTQLMTLFALLALLAYVGGISVISNRPLLGGLLLGLALFPFGLLSVLSKENGSLLLILLASMHWLFFHGRIQNRLLVFWFRAGILLPLVLLFLYLLYSVPATVEGYATRPFSLDERLLTESRILIAYLFEIFIPNTINSGLFHDDILVSTSLLNPVTTLFSAFALIAILIAAIRYRSSQPVFTFAVFWFLGMHLLESTYIPLELYFEHRNYISMIGPLMAVVWYGSKLLQKSDNKQVKGALVAGLALFITCSSALTLSQSLLWRDAEEVLSHWADERPASSRAQTTLARHLVAEGRIEEAYERIQLASSFHPNDASLLLVSWNLSCRLGVTPPVSLQDIASHEQLENNRDVINVPLREFLTNYISGYCTYPAREEMIALFDRLEELEYSDGNKSVFHYIYSDLYVLLGDLNNALIQLSRSFEYYNNPDLVVRQAMLAASAQSFEAALVFLDRAEAAFENWPGPSESSINEVNAMRQDINQVLQGLPQN